jgi:cytochrome c oxidase subunit 2
MRRAFRLVGTPAAVAISCLAPAGCAGVQSALAPSGSDASSIASLFWWMAGGALAAWAGTIALALYYGRRGDGGRNRRRDRFLIVGAGVVVPTVTLTVLLVFGLAMLPRAVARAPEGSLRIDVVGEQWWWRVTYQRPGAGPVVLANEIRLPVGEPAQFRLESDNVIHSFWIPSLAGKMDMIPGRVTWLTVRPTRTGVFRGACAEYCGTSHALMAFYVEVMDRADFDRWLSAQSAPAMEPRGEPAARGSELFQSNGCGACHAVRGTPADGVIGPDLTHVGGRLSIGAGILPTEPEPLRRWIARSEAIKPGVHMPAFGMLPDDELRALAAYLHDLK